MTLEEIADGLQHRYEVAEKTLTETGITHNQEWKARRIEMLLNALLRVRSLLVKEEKQMFRYKLVEALEKLAVEVDKGMTPEEAVKLLESIAHVIKTVGIAE